MEKAKVSLKNKIKNKLIREPVLFHPSVFEENNELVLNNNEISWIAPEYLQRPKTASWWAGAFVVLIIAITIEALTGDWTMLAVTLMFAFVYWTSHTFRPPKKTKITLSSKGIKIGYHFIPFSDIEFFWIIYNPPEVKQLFFRVRKRLFADIVVELEGQNPDQIKYFLEEHLTEVMGVQESFSDIILRLLKL